MKPNKDFRMSKQTKVMLASTMFMDPAMRSSFKRSMIEAQLSTTKHVGSADKNADKNQDKD